MSESEGFDKEVQILVEESPKLDASMKNLLALLSAKSLELEDPIPLNELLSCARCVLKQLNAYELVDVVSFGSKHPQGAMTALDRIDQLRYYKVVLALWQKSKEMNAKVSKLFGKSFIKWSCCWKDIRLAIVNDSPQDVPDDVLQLFLDTFEISLELSVTEQSGLVETPDNGADIVPIPNEQEQDAINTVLRSLAVNPKPVKKLSPSIDDKDLIWAANFKDALAERRFKREQKVEDNTEWKDETLPPPTEEDVFAGTKAS